MKTRYYLILTVVLLFAAFGKSLAQPCVAGGCLPSSTQWPSGLNSTTSTTFVPISSSMYAGEYALCSVVSGTTYQWSLCTVDGGIASYDSELTLFRASTNFPLCYNEDFCGLDAKITWTASFTGNVKIQINQDGCQTNSINTTLVWRVGSGTGSADAAVRNVYSMGIISKTHSNPHVVKARISNLGTTTFTNRPVTLSVTGANSFSNTQTIASLAPGASTIVTFAGYNSTSTGTNTVTVSVPADGNLSNNSLSVSQSVNNNAASYQYGSTRDGGLGFNAGTGEVAAKFTTSGATTITQVNVPFNLDGAAFRLKIWSATAAGNPGTVLYTSPIYYSSTGTNYLTVSPAVPVSGTFFVGAVQVTAGINYGIAYQDETPLRTGTFYGNANPATPSWSDI